MAADSLAVVADRKYTTRKLYRIRGALVGVSGKADHGVMFVRWYDHGADFSDRPRGNKFDATALVLDKNGIFRYEAESYPIPVLDDFAATGSGSDIALAAMMLGKTPAEAVALACQIDLHTGPPVVVEKL